MRLSWSTGTRFELALTEHGRFSAVGSSTELRLDRCANGRLCCTGGGPAGGPGRFGTGLKCLASPLCLPDCGLLFPPRTFACTTGGGPFGGNEGRSTVVFRVRVGMDGTTERPCTRSCKGSCGRTFARSICHARAGRSEASQVNTDSKHAR